MFNAQFYKKNRKDLFLNAQADVVIISSAGLLQRSVDTTYVFKQDNNFLYLTGCNQPDFVLVITAKKHILVQPNRDKHRVLWEGAIDTAAIKSISDVDEVLTHNDGWEFINQLVEGKKLATIAPAKPYISAHGFYTNPARALLHTRLKKLKPAQIINAQPLIAKQRQHKTPAEITAIQTAIDITQQSLQVVKDNMANYKNESNIMHMLTYEFMQRGAQGHAYDPIIATDKNATTIHYVANNSPLKGKNMILFDVGAEYNNYAADISRTYALRSPGGRLTAVHDAVLAVQQQLIESLKPGITIKELEQKTEYLLAQQVKSLGLSGNVRNFYPHGVSHHLGLDVHDPADYKQPLQPGMVITIEPGIYIAEENIGVRIEDDVLITDSGARNLSKNVPTDLLYYL